MMAAVIAAACCAGMRATSRGERRHSANTIQATQVANSVTCAPLIESRCDTAVALNSAQSDSLIAR